MLADLIAYGVWVDSKLTNLVLLLIREQAIGPHLDALQFRRADRQLHIFGERRGQAALAVDFLDDALRGQIVTDFFDEPLLV